MTEAEAKLQTPPSLLKTALIVAGLAGSAALSAVSLQSANGVWLGWVMLIPLLLAIRDFAPMRAMFAGAFWGVCLFAFAAAANGGVFEASAGAFIRLAVFPALYACFGSFVTRRKGFSPLVLGLGWVAVELALQPLGLRNGLLAGTLDHSLVVRTLGYTAGYTLVAFAIVYVNASLLLIAAGAATVPGGSRRAPRAAGNESKQSIPELSGFLSAFLGNRHARAPPAR